MRHVPREPSDQPFHGILAAGASGAGAPGLFGLLLLMEAGVPVPLPGDLVLLLVGERVAALSLPLWTAVLTLELVAVAGTASLFWLARGPGQALVTRIGPRVGLTGPRLARASALLQRRGRMALAVLAALAVALLLWWRRRAAAGRVLAEGCCPVCLVAGAAGLRRELDDTTP